MMKYDFLSTLAFTQSGGSGDMDSVVSQMINSYSVIILMTAVYDC